MGAEARLFSGVEDGLLLVAEARELSGAGTGWLVGLEARLFSGVEDGLLVGPEARQLSEAGAG